MKALLYSVIFSPALLWALFAAPVHAQDDPCENPVDRLAQTACLEVQVEQAEEELERVLKAVLEVIDKEIRWESEVEEWKKALQRNQEYWLRYRYSECQDLMFYYYGTGNDIGQGVARCQLNMTKERIRALKERYGLELEP